jgi:hypothetical protein
LREDFGPTRPTIADTPPSDTNRRPASLPPVLTDEGLAFAVNQFTD